MELHFLLYALAGAIIATVLFAVYGYAKGKPSTKFFASIAFVTCVLSVSLRDYSGALAWSVVFLLYLHTGDLEDKIAELNKK